MKALLVAIGLCCATQAFAAEAARVVFTADEVRQMLQAFTENEVMVKAADGSIHPFIGSGTQRVISILQSRLKQALDAQPPPPAVDPPKETK